MWTSVYDNDTGMNDEGFWEFWTVTDGSKEYKCDNKEDADWLCRTLNSIAPNIILTNNSICTIG